MHRLQRIAGRYYLNLLYRINAEKYKEKYPVYLRKLGVRIPEDYREGGHGFIHPTASFDGNDFSLISIGKNTTISANVVLLTHDYSITKGLQSLGIPDQARFLKPVRVGENAFVGMNCILLPGATVGNNVILGAGSVVTGTIPDNVVAAGNPARVLCTLEEWTRKHIRLGDYEVTGC